MFHIKQHGTEQPMNQRQNQWHLDTNKNGSITYKNLQDAANIVASGKYIEIDADI